MGIAEEDKALQSFIKNLCGYKPSKTQLPVYRSVWDIHPDTLSYNDQTNRLACLGAAVIKEVVTHFLYRKFLMASASQIVEASQKITSRTYLNRMVKRLKMDRYHLEGEKALLLREHINANILKAFVGAVYIDKGHDFAEKCITKQLLLNASNLESILQENSNYKGKLMAWAQKNKSEIAFKATQELKYGERKVYVISLYINKEWISNGCDSIVKNAEQLAAMAACETLEI